MTVRTRVPRSAPRSETNLGFAVWTLAALVGGIVAGFLGILTPAAASVVVALGAAFAAVQVGYVVPAAVIAAAPVAQLFFPAILPSAVIVLAALFVAAEWALGRVSIAAPMVAALAMAYGAWAFLSGMWSVDVNRTVSHGLTLTVALLCGLTLATLVRSQDAMTFVLRVASAASITAAAVAYWQAFIEGVDRPTGAALDPNVFALLQVSAIPLILLVANFAVDPAIRLCLFGAVFFVAGSVLISQSRGGAIALVAVMAAISLAPTDSLFASHRRRRNFCAFLLVAGVVAAAVFGGELLSRDDAAESAAGSGREAIWEAASRSIAERPGLGLGYGAFNTVSLDLLRETPDIDLEHFRIEDPGEINVHNVYLATSAELGLPGLGVFLGLLLSALVVLRRAYVFAVGTGRQDLARVGVALALSLFAWAVASIFLATEASFILWSLLGLSIALVGIVDRACGLDLLGTEEPQA